MNVHTTDIGGSEDHLSAQQSSAANGQPFRFDWFDQVKTLPPWIDAPKLQSRFVRLLCPSRPIIN
jgi:hypothetical protein